MKLLIFPFKLITPRSGIQPLPLLDEWNHVTQTPSYHRRTLLAILAVPDVKAAEVVFSLCVALI